MTISVADVKKLREITGAGPVDCKKALEENNGDFALAEKQLKEKGLAAVEKRADRATKEGKVFIKLENNSASIVEIVAETDFVARNPDFIAMGEKIAEIALEKKYTNVQPDISEMVSNLSVKIGEKMELKRVKLVTAGSNEYITSYIHGDGAIGVIVKLASDNPEVLENDEFKEFAFNIALHIAAFNPMALNKGKLDPAYIKEQEGIFRSQMENDDAMKSKPASALEKILQGKVNKFVSEICLMDQDYVKDDKLTVSQVLAEYTKRFGANISIVDYVYLKVGQ